MDKIPCETCITFAICKLQVTRFKALNLGSLRSKCSILREYTKDGRNNINRLFAVMEFYGATGLAYNKYNKGENVTHVF